MLENIRSIAKANGITYQKLASQSGMKLGTLGCYMSGTNPLHHEAAAKIWQALAQMLDARIPKASILRIVHTYEH